MSTAPIRVLTPRYRCPFCSHSRAGRAAVTAHIGRCWSNPATRSCRTCRNYQQGGDGEQCVPGQPCGCNVYPDRCAAGVQLPAGPAFPVTGCPSWAGYTVTSIQPA